MSRPLHKVVTAHRFTATAVVLLLCLMASPPEARAQAQEQDPAPPERSGFWLSLGAGSGWDIPTSIVPGERPEGLSGFLRAGGAVSSQVLFGGEVIGRSLKKAGKAEHRGNATFVMLVYPRSTSSFFIKGGVGPAFVGESHGGGYRGTYTLGLGLTAGAGYEVLLAGGLQVTPGIDLLYQSFHAGPNLRSTHRLLLVTVGLAWY